MRIEQPFKRPDIVTPVECAKTGVRDAEGNVHHIQDIVDAFNRMALEIEECRAKEATS